ncbi:MAG: methyltransferase domain-containing protein [Betaproteobacteria bacterium]|nr:methyltransferase domain-containing protein [Betaproteobacteria bacterium]
MHSPRSHTAQVVGYYDAHPINEDQILRALSERGLDLDRITQDDLQTLDQDHYGGLEANDALISAAGIRPGHLVLDVCSGMGGPSRYVAHRIGCRVVGLDLTPSRYESAQRLTKRVGLDHLVSFRLGSALDMPFEDASFDVIMGQEAWCHVPEKPRLIAECARVLRPGGVIAFTDILRKAGLTESEMDRLRAEMTFPELGTLDGYAALLEEQGCRVERRDDLSAEWTRILVDRLAMYRGLGRETARKFGEGRSKDWDAYYTFFVGLYEAGKLGGGRFVARKGGD